MRRGLSQHGYRSSGNFFSPASLFVNGEQGAWYDPSDLTTLFQDSAGTTPVTAVEQPVGRMLDKSGRGNHATQSTSTSRPVLRQDGNGKYYLAFDGIDDSLLTNSVDFTATDKMTVWAGVRKLSDAATGTVVDFNGVAGTNAFMIRAPSGAANNYVWYSGGSLSFTGAIASSFVAPITNVLTGIGDIANDGQILRVNAVQAASSTADQGTGNYGNYPIYIGRRGGASLPFNGNLYSLIIRGAQSTDSQISATESWVNGKTGAY